MTLVAADPPDVLGSSTRLLNGEKLDQLVFDQHVSKTKRLTWNGSQSSCPLQNSSC